MEKRQYECLMIVENTVKEDETRKKLVDKFAKMAGADVKVDVWGLKKFATEINHKKDGYYYLLNFTATPDVPRAMNDLMNITDGIVRAMFVCKDDQKQAVKSKKKPAKKPAAEVVSE